MFLRTHFLQVWGLTIVKDKYLVTGCGDNELRVWSIAPKGEAANDSEKTIVNTEGFVTGEDTAEVEGIVSILIYMICRGLGFDPSSRQIFFVVLLPGSINCKIN